MKRITNRTRFTALTAAVCSIALVSAACSKQPAQEQAGQQAEAPAVLNQLPLTDKPITYNFLLQEFATAPAKNDWPIVKEMAARTNVQLNFNAVPAANWNDKVKVLIATNEIPDIAKVSADDADRYGPDGVFMNLKPLIEKYAPNIKKFLERDELKGIVTAPDGGIYAIPQLNAAKVERAFLVRKDVMDELGLEEPKTDTDFYNLLKAFKQKYPDSAPLISRDKDKTFYNFTPQFGVAPLANMIGFDETTNRYVFGPAEQKENFRTMITFLNKLYAEGLLDKEYIVSDESKWKERFYTNKGFVSADLMGRVSLTADGKKTNPNFVVDGLAPFASSAGKRKVLNSTTVNRNNSFALSPRIKQPEVAIRFLDYLFSPEGLDYVNWGIEGDTYTVDAAGKKQYTDKVYKDRTILRKDYGIMDDGLRGLVYQEQFDILLDDQRRAAQDNYMKNGYLGPEPHLLPATEKENEVFKEKYSQLEKFVIQEVNKFIMGARPLSEYDKFVEDSKKYGYEELAAIRNDQYKRMTGSK